MAVDVGRIQVERVHQELLDLGGRVGLDLQPHGRAAAALAHLFLDGLEQVLDLVVVDLDVAVARDAEDGIVFDLHAGEQLRQVHADDGFQRREDVTRRLAGSAGSGTKRGSTPGTCTTANSFSSSPGRCSTTARLSDLLSRCGNGWPGSMASGVSTGKISRRKTSPRCLRSRLGQVAWRRAGRCPRAPGPAAHPRAGSDRLGRSSRGPAAPMRSSCS